MDNTKKIIIGIIIVIIAIGIILVMTTTTSESHETIEITPNGTTIEVPSNNQTKYQGDMGGIKIWNWDNGVLVTYNSHNYTEVFELAGLTTNVLSSLIDSGEKENADGFQCYVLDADELLKNEIFDDVRPYYNGKFYCIPLNNITTQDNIIICCKDKDLALDMAKSVKYKKVYSFNSTIDSTINNTISDLENTTIDLANNYTEQIISEASNNLK